MTLTCNHLARGFESFNTDQVRCVRDVSRLGGASPQRMRKLGDQSTIADGHSELEVVSKLGDGQAACQAK